MIVQKIKKHEERLNEIRTGVSLLQGDPEDMRGQPGFTEGPVLFCVKACLSRNDHTIWFATRVATIWCLKSNEVSASDSKISLSLVDWWMLTGIPIDPASPSTRSSETQAIAPHRGCPASVLC